MNQAFYLRRRFPVDIALNSCGHCLSAFYLVRLFIGVYDFVYIVFPHNLTSRDVQLYVAARKIYTAVGA